MKKIILSLIMLTGIFHSCNTDLDINKDPDFLDSNSAPLNAQLPSSIIGVVGSQGGLYSIIGGFWSQYWTQSNAANQYKNIDNYSLSTNDYQGGWNGMYDALGDIRNVKKLASENQNWNYYLISTVLEVHASQILTDFYGSIPYKEANNIALLNPKFDSGQDVYSYMIDDLNSALAKDLSTSKGDSPSNDDLIFSGNMSKWTKFANTLKLKIYMRQISSSRSAFAIAGINQLLTSGVSFLDVDASMVQFIDEINQSNPLFEANNRRLNVATNLRMSSTLSSYLNINADPRRAAYYGAGNALNQGDFTNAVGAGTIAVVTLKPTTPVFLISLEESLFLQAEALERFSGGIGAKAKYDGAITSNFNRYSLIATPFLTGVYAYPTGTLDDKIKAIITQKWVSNFPGNGHESFFEQNRTGYPKISTVKQNNPLYVAGEIAYAVNGVTGNLFPRRLPYPISERNANVNTPDLISITTPVWWD